MKDSLEDTYKDLKPNFQGWVIEKMKEGLEDTYKDLKPSWARLPRAACSLFRRYL